MFIMLGALLAGTSLLPLSRAAVLFVGGAGPGNHTTIQSAVDSASPGDTVFVFNGTYYEHVLINKSVSLTGESRDATVIDGGGNGSTVTITADWVNVSGFTLTQNPVGWEWSIRGIDVISAQDCVLTDNHISESGYGIHLFESDNCRISGNLVEFIGKDSITLEVSHGNTIENNTVTGSLVGLDLISSASNTVTGNHFEAHTYFGIGINGPHNVVKDNFVRFGGETCITVWSDGSVIDGNEISGCGWGSWMGPGPGMYVSGSGNRISNNTISDAGSGISLGGTNHVVLGNHISDNEYTGIWVGGSSNTIQSNTIGWNGLADIALGYSSANVLIGNSMWSGGVSVYGDKLEHWNTHDIPTTNTVNGKPVQYRKDISGGTIPTGAGQVILANCNGVTVRDQEIKSVHSGVSLGFSSTNVIENVTISANMYGTYLYSSHSNVISNVSVSGTYGRYGSYGIYLKKSSWNLITNGHVIYNQDGIRLSESSMNTVTGFVAEYGNWSGITILDSVGNVISKNVLVNNSVGVKSIRSGNEIYHNSFIDNAVQAMDDSNAVQWDNGYPSGGNYWSDYAGVDWYSGPFQDQPGSDGIGDTPYVIDADSQDRYPHVYPGVSPPSVRDGRLSGGSLENVKVDWDLSRDDGAGNMTVVGYRVYRSSAYDRGGQGYSLVASLPGGAGTYVDVNAGSGDPSSYFYRVCAVHSSGQEACAVNQAAKYRRPLARGPHLVSVPLVQSNESIEAVLRTVVTYRAWTYDPWTGGWASFVESKAYLADSVSVNHTTGLWIDPATECDLAVAGIVPLQTVIFLHEGWNLVGFPSFGLAYTVADLKAETGATRVEGFDLTAPPHFLGVLTDEEVLRAGCGYWVKVDAPTQWVVWNV